MGRARTAAISQPKDIRAAEDEGGGKSDDMAGGDIFQIQVRRLDDLAVDGLGASSAVY